MTKFDIFGLGNPIFDLQYKISDSKLVELGKKKGIMHLISKDEQQNLLLSLHSEPLGHSAGGDVPNVLITAQMLGASTALSGKTGNDDFGKLYSDRLASRGVASCLRIGDGLTASCIVLISPDGERTMNTYLGMCQEFGPLDLDTESLVASRIFFVTGYFWDTTNQKEAVQKALKIAREADKIIAFDLADPFAVGRSKEDFNYLINNHIDILFANEQEAQAQTGLSDTLAAIKELGQKVPICLVKRGSRGSLLSYHGEIHEIPAISVTQVLDTTGAGDNFAAGFLAGISENKTFKEISELSLEDCLKAAKLASETAAKVIQQIGAQLASI